MYMKKPALVIMAAGMGSRYGGLKQIDPMDQEGHLLIDFSIYDAVQAGFRRIVFIIKEEMEEDFREIIGDRISKFAQVDYVYQKNDNLPQGFVVPEGRTKPFGTGHAVLSCNGVIDGPFAVINADDFYGRNAFRLMYEFLEIQRDDSGKYHFAMVGYELEKTLTENGHVARGVCELDDCGMLKGIRERTRIERRQDMAAYTEDDGVTWNEIPSHSIVSMNMWGFSPAILEELSAGFGAFLTEELQKNPLKCEYFLPMVVGRLLKEGRADVTVMHTPDQWYGVTYREDKPVVMEAIRRWKEEGIYPEQLWEERA